MGGVCSWGGVCSQGGLLLEGCLVQGGLLLGVPGLGGLLLGGVPGPGGAWWRRPPDGYCCGSTHPTGMHSFLLSFVCDAFSYFYVMCNVFS